MDERFRQETQALERSWMRHDRQTLRDYLVQDVEDPRINVQSILTRQFLIERLFGDRFAVVAEQELRFALVLNWAMTLLRQRAEATQIRGILDALLVGRGQGDGNESPGFVRETFDGLDVPNYVCDLLGSIGKDVACTAIPGRLLSTFELIWSDLLAGEHPQRLAVLEPACGSANDYRFIRSYGVGRYLDYVGFDLCEKNVENARRMFPDVPFDVGNVLDMTYSDKSFDCCIVHDLFEHLSAEGIERAIAEICRVTRRAVCIGFFNMCDDIRHTVKPVREYHWNRLSVSETTRALTKHSRAVDVIHIDAYLRSRFGYAKTHNKGAYTFIVHL